MSVLSLVGNIGINAYAVVAHTQRKIVRVSKFYVQLIGPRMHASVANGFVADAIDFVTNDGMHLVGITNHRKCDRRIQLPGFTACAEYHKTAGFTRSG